MSDDEVEVKAEDEGVGLDWAGHLLLVVQGNGRVTHVNAVCLPNTLSRVLRVEIHYRDNKDVKQKLLVIVKRPPIDPFTKMFLAESGLDDSESIFYNEVAPLLTAAGAGEVAPQWLRAHPDELVVRDARAEGFRRADFAAGLSEQQARAALAAAAKLHAKSLGAAATAARRGGAARAAGVRALQRGLARLAAMLRGCGAAGAAAARLAARAPALLRPAAAPPPSPAILAHGDLWAGNLLFSTASRGRPARAVAVDWRLARAAGAPGAADDVALLVLSSLETDERRRIAPKLLDYYCERLAAETDRSDADAEAMYESIVAAVRPESGAWKRACLRALALCAGGADALRGSPRSARAAQRRLLAAADDLLLDLDDELLAADSPPPSPPPPPSAKRPP